MIKHAADLKLPFGKFMGRTLKSLLNTEEGIAYVRWLASDSMYVQWKNLAKEALKKARL